MTVPGEDHGNPWLHAFGRLAMLARRSEGEARVHAYTKLLETVRFFSTIPVVPFDMASNAVVAVFVFCPCWTLPVEVV